MTTDFEKKGAKRLPNVILNVFSFFNFNHLSHIVVGFFNTIKIFNLTQNIKKAENK